MDWIGQIAEKMTEVGKEEGEQLSPTRSGDVE